MGLPIWCPVNPEDAKKDKIVALAYRDIFAISCDKRNKTLFDQAVAIERAIEKGGGTVRQVTEESCGSGQESAGAADGTHFRGLYINMPRAEVQSLRISDFKIETALCKATIVSQSNGKKCGEITFGKDARVEEMTLASCFFSAEQLDFKSFTKDLTQNYKLTDMNCKSNNGYSQSVGSYVSFMECSGWQKSNEWISITGADLGNAATVFGNEVNGIALKVTRRPSSQRPTFN